MALAYPGVRLLDLAVEDLPEDATIKDAIERLVLLPKIEVGLKQVAEGKTIPLDEVRSELEDRRRSSEQD